MLPVDDSGVKLSLGKTRVKKQQVEMMIGQNIITRMLILLNCFFFVNQTSVAFISNW